MKRFTPWSEHQIRWTVDADGVTALIDCSAVDGARCRLACSNAKCQAPGRGVDDGHTHDFIDSGVCQFNANIDIGDCRAFEMYSGLTAEIRNGPIDIVYVDEIPSYWTYTGDAPTIESLLAEIDDLLRGSRCPQCSAVEWCGIAHLRSEHETAMAEAIAYAGDPANWADAETARAAMVGIIDRAAHQKPSR